MYGAIPSPVSEFGIHASHSDYPEEGGLYA